MAGINKVIIVGNLGQDPEVKALDSGSTVASLSIATSESWTDKQTGAKQEKTEWHRVVMFNRLAEIAGQYLKKGSKAYIEGKLQTRKWQDQQGNDRYVTEIVANQLQMLDSRQDSGFQSAGNSGAPAPQRTNARSQDMPPAQNQMADASFNQNPDMGFDDDIPF